MSNGLAIIAHGSRNPAANTEFLELVCRLAGTTQLYNAVHGCFLELASPSLDEALDKLRGGGAERIDIYPLFFNQGKHVTRDIPALVDNASRRYPDTRIRLLPYFGAFEGLTSLIDEHLHDINTADSEDETP